MAWRGGFPKVGVPQVIQILVGFVLLNHPFLGPWKPPLSGEVDPKTIGIARFLPGGEPAALRRVADRAP